jgi:HSP20 family molecular chaperone IbpA
MYSPSVDIFENENSLTLLADMPGVKAEDLKIDLRDNVLTLTGHVSSREAPGEQDVLREYAAGTFFRQFTVSETIDQAKIDAKLSDGVLRLELPKVEKAKPRQISVRGA